MDTLHFIILALATYRISSLFVNEDGPFDVFLWIRDRVGVRHNEYGQAYGLNVIGEALACIWCFSVYAGIGWAVLYYYYPLTAYWLALPLALSAVTMIVDKQV